MVKMVEYLTEAIVLDKELNGDADGLVVLYTKDLGKIIAKAKSIKKATSKLNGHLEPLNLVSVRLISKSGFQVIDALTINRFSRLRESAVLLPKFIEILQFIKTATFEGQEDYRFWTAIKKIIEHVDENPAVEVDYDQKLIYRFLLKIMGFDSENAICAFCSKKEINSFLLSDHIFLCGQCGNVGDNPENSLKVIENRVLLI